MNKSYVLLPILAVIFISGCVGDGGTGAGNGVAVLDFGPDISNVYSGDLVKLRLRVQNQGTVDARNVIAEITGITPSEWGVIILETLGDLKGFNPTNNIQGAVKTVEWTDLIAPQLPEGQLHTYTPEVRVSYDYTTTATKGVTIVDSAELLRIKDTGGSLPTSAVTESTAGPLSVDVQVQSFVRSSFAGIDYDIFPIYIRITNTGGGSVVPGIFGQTDYPVQLQITPPTGTIFRYTGIDEDCTTGIMFLNMWQGRTLELTCELEVISPPTYSEERLMTIKSDYTYQIRKPSQITVSGTSQGFF